MFYKIVLFFLLHFFSFFPRGADSRKGPSCVPIHKKKEKKLSLKCKLKELKLSNVANVVDDLALDDAVGRDAPLSV